MLQTSPSAPRSMFAVPGWLNAQPGVEPLPWPSSPHRFPVEDYYAELLAAVSPTADDDRAVRGWLPVLRERVSDAVRPHALDVDVVTCGSFATGTHLVQPLSDLDLVARLHTLDTSDSSASALLHRIRGWIAHGLDANVVVARGAIVITDRATDAAGVRVRVIPCAPRDGGLRPIAALNGDPLAHRDLILARDRAVGGDAVMRRAIRIVKYVNAFGRSQDEATVITSYEIESLALACLVCPTSLGEAVAALLKTIMSVIRGRSTSPGGGRAPEAAIAFFSDVADVAEQAMRTLDRQVVFDRMNATFAQSQSGDAGLRQECR